MRINELIFEVRARHEDAEAIKIVNDMKNQGATPAEIMKRFNWTPTDYSTFMQRVQRHGEKINLRHFPKKEKEPRRQIYAQYDSVRELIIATPEISVREIELAINNEYGEGTISKENIYSWLKKVKNELNIPVNKIDRNQLAQTLMQLYDPSLPYVAPPTNWSRRDSLPEDTSDMQLLQSVRNISPDYRGITLRQMLIVLKKLAFTNVLKLNRNPGPPAWNGPRRRGPHTDVGMPREAFYDPMLTTLENGIIGMARNGYSNEMITDEWRDLEADEVTNDDGSEKLSVTPSAVGVQISKIKSKLGIKVAAVGAARSSDIVDDTLRGRTLKGLQMGQTVRQIAQNIEIIDQKTKSPKTVSDKFAILQALISRERKPYRRELATKLGRDPSPLELNRALPDYLKITRMPAKT